MKSFQKKAQIEQNHRGGVIQGNSTPYRVDGEVGRFEFTSHRVESSGICIYNTATDLFSPIGPREYYRTVGFDELALSLSTAMSYRKTIRFLNRVRWQTEKGTPMTTLANIIEIEGTQAQQELERQAQQILMEHAFNPEGAPQKAELTYGLLPEQASLPIEQVLQAIKSYNQDKSEGYRISASMAEQLYENREKTVSTSIDDVGVKKQKETGRSPEQLEKEAREYAHNTIAHVENGNRSYVLNGTNNESVLKLLIAFLLHNHLLQECYHQFFVDGARNLHASILSAFTWLPHCRILLDWYHLEKKCEYELSLTLKGSKIRNAILEKLLPLLWLGNVDAAIACLQAIQPTLLKNDQSVDRLVGYFERNRAYIPCYALRKKLGLRISSNKGEKANDLCVATRQKHNGMSWSKNGSVALATVTALHLNHESENWISHKQIKFKFAS